MRTAFRLLSFAGGSAVFVDDRHAAIVVALAPAQLIALFLVSQFLLFSLSHAGWTPSSGNSSSYSS